MRLVIEAAEQLGVEYLVLNQREARYIDLCLRVQDGSVDGVLCIREEERLLTAFSGVYVRLMDYQDLPENQYHGRTPPDGDAVYKSQVLHQSLIEWLELADCRVMNRLSAMGSNMSKPYQAQLIARSGFRTPATLITNEPEEIRSFLRMHKRVIYKSVSSVRSIVKELGDIKINELHKVRYLPTQFQAFVPGTNVRVHVAGHRLFTTEIQTEAVDYRYASYDGIDANMVPVTLPPEIEARCVVLAQALELPLCGIDLKRTPGGDYYCFEVNPSPGFSYYQESTGQPIAAAIVEYLQHGAGTSP